MILSIRIINGEWRAIVLNTQVSFPFEGADLEAQAGAVEKFATAMQEGNAASAINSLATAGAINADGEILEEEQIIQIVFGETTFLDFAAEEGAVGSTMWAAEEGEVMLDALEEVGGILLAALF